MRSESRIHPSVFRCFLRTSGQRYSRQIPIPAKTKETGTLLLEDICIPVSLLKPEIACFRMAGRDSEGWQRVKFCLRFFLSAEFEIVEGKCSRGVRVWGWRAVKRRRHLERVFCALMYRCAASERERALRHHTRTPRRTLSPSIISNFTSTNLPPDVV